MPGSYTIEQKYVSKEKVHEMLLDLPSFMQYYVDYCYGASNMAPRTVLAYMYDHKAFLEYLAEKNGIQPKEITAKMIDNLTVLDLQAYMAHITVYEKNGIKRENNFNARSRKLSSLRALYRWMLSVNMVTQNTALLVTMPKHEKKKIVRLEHDEIKTVLNGAKTQDTLTENQKSHSKKHQYRDLAILTLLLHTGIRVSECVGIDYRDVDWERARIRIDRKGRKEAYAYLNDTAYTALSEYCDFERPETESDAADDPFFISQKGGRMTVRAMEYLVKKYTAQVVPGDRKISPHKLRATFATELYKETSDLYKVSNALGHENISTTVRYTDIDDEALIDASREIEKAYRKK